MTTVIFEEKGGKTLLVMHDRELETVIKLRAREEALAAEIETEIEIEIEIEIERQKKAQ